MITKNHKKNTNFQIVYFLIGSCSTPDGAYSLLCDLKEERQGALDAYEVTKLKNEARKLRIEKLLKGDEADVDRKSTRLNSSHTDISRMPSSA